jgi:hypothetical protein
MEHMAKTWQTRVRHTSTLRLLCICHVSAMLPCMAMMLPCVCHVVARCLPMSLPMPLPLHLPCRCHAFPVSTRVLYVNFLNADIQPLCCHAPVCLQAGGLSRTNQFMPDSPLHGHTCVYTPCLYTTTCCGHIPVRHICSVTVDTSLNGPALLLGPKRTRAATVRVDGSSPPVQSNPPRITIHLKVISPSLPTCVASVLESAPLSAPQLELGSAPLSAPLFAPASVMLKHAPGAIFHSHTAPSSRDGRANHRSPCARSVDPETARPSNAR